MIKSVVWWLALLSHSEIGLGSNPSWVLSVRSAGFLEALCFLPQSEHMFYRMSGDFKLPLKSEFGVVVCFYEVLLWSGHLSE